MLRLVAFIAAHALLARLLPAPWSVPNLTLIGLMQTGGASPGRWLPLALIAGLSSAMWAARGSGALLVSYLVVGACVRLISGGFDTAEPRVQSLLAAILCVPLTTAWLWLDGHWSWTLAGWSFTHMSLTAVAALLLQRRVVGG